MSRAAGRDWIDAENPLDSGVRLPERVIDWAWRGQAVATAYAEHRSLRTVAAQFGINHEKVRALVAKFAPADAPVIDRTAPSDHIQEPH